MADLATPWIAFWNADTSIYVNQRHSDAHYRVVAASIAEQIQSPTHIVLDFGCGEALAAEFVASRCAKLLLCEGAPAVRKRLRARFKDVGGIEVVDQSLDAVADRSVDLLIVNSVVQYMSVEALHANLVLWRTKLAQSGQLILSDVMPPRSNALQDAWSLLRFAAGNGFLIAAVLGLARTAISAYPRLRRALGLLRFEEVQMLSLLAKKGFSAQRANRNLGYNQGRMAFIASLETSMSDAPGSSMK